MCVLPSFISFLFALLFSQVSSLAFIKVIEVTKGTLDLVSSVSGVWDIVNDYGDFAETPSNRKERLLFSKIDQINVKLDELDEKIGGLHKDVEALERTLKKLPQTLQYQRLFEKLRDHQIFIDGQYDDMQRYVRDYEDYENSTLIDFSNNIISHSDNSVKTMNRVVYETIMNTDFLEILRQQLTQDNGDFLCHQLSPQQIYYNILQKTLLGNSKAYIMIQFAYMIKKIFDEGNFTKEAQDANTEFKTRTDKIIVTIKRYMARASTELWKCDPETHILDETYTAITNLVQGYILNVVNLDKRGKCHDSCDSFTYTKTHDCRDNEWCKSQPRCPKILSCKFFDDEMDVCTMNPSSGRRYKYVEYDNGRKFGTTSGGCTKKDLFHLEKYREWLIYECSYCFCLCDTGGGPYSDRYINLRASIADIFNNNVVTGLRFIKHNRIVHLQIQEGTLLPGGQIDSKSVHWVPPEDYRTIDKYIYEGQDYHTLSWEQRGIDLTTVAAPNGSVVTGVRFRRIGTRLDLEVLVTPFDFITGKLINPRMRSYYRSAPNVNSRHKFNRELTLYKPDVPIRVTSSSVPDRTTNKYVRFTNSDYDKDAAQTTVPFFDTQRVESVVPVPLRGVGIYHKGRRESGGFIAPKIYTYDFSQHLAPLFGN